MKILQFGTGRFLRGFFAPIVKEPQSITVVQSRSNSDGAQAINAQPDGYHVWTRGISQGKTLDQYEKVHSISRALIANTQWGELKQLGIDHELQLIVSNTTAAGLQLSNADADVDFRNDCPESFPAKITALLYFRFKKELPGVTLLPLELVENNGSLLKRLVLEQATQWNLNREPEFLDWLESGNRWLNNLVDRIVVLPTDDPPWPGEDHLAVAAEPFRMLAIANDGKASSPLPDDEMIIWTDDLAPFFLRKVRILNGLHTAMVAKFMPRGFETVLQCVTDHQARKWLDALLNEEILPTLESLGLSESEFAHDVMERFENPFFKHKLADIALGHSTKLEVRVQPTALDFHKAFGRKPKMLTEVLQANVSSEVPT